jgi:hypothetical protein
LHNYFTEADMNGLTDPYGGLFATDPTVNPAYLQLPAAQEQPPVPYSPEGWAQSKLTAQVEGETAGSKKPDPKKKEGEVGFTPEQMLALSKMTGAPERLRPAGGGGAAAPRNSVGQMQMLTTPGGKEQTAPRASLGQIIYGGRKF